MEKKVTALVEESTRLAAKGDYSSALEKAKLSEKCERHLQMTREQRGLVDQTNIDLTYCVQFNLAVQYHNNKLYSDAQNTYAGIVRNKQYALASRLKVNLGNIFYETGKFPIALKMYKQALDQIPLPNRDVRVKVMRNIGNALVKMGQYQEAIGSYEAIFENGRNDVLGDSVRGAEARDIKAAFNVLVCYYAIGHKTRMRQSFHRLLEVRFYQQPGGGLDDDEWAVDDPAFQIQIPPAGGGAAGGAAPARDTRDPLRHYLRERRETYNRMVVTAARLIAPVIERDWVSGYDAVITALRHFEHDAVASARLAAELEMCRALEFLRNNQFSRAVEALLHFEQKEMNLRARAATNLAYLYFLDGNVEAGERSARVAVETTKFSAKAHVNMGNFHFLKGHYDAAKDSYRTALECEADCVEAEYNLGLSHTKTAHYAEALRCFERLAIVVPDSIEVLYQVANLLELRGQTEQAQTAFDALRARVPTDPAILSRLGALFYNQEPQQGSGGERVGTSGQSAVDYYVEAYRYLPVDLDVIAWLGAYFVRSGVYEKAIAFFDRAAQIAPQDEKWQLLVANCHRRLGEFAQAKRLYEEIHRRHPSNVESVRYLVHLSNDMGLKDEALEWHKKLKRLEDRAAAAAGHADGNNDDVVIDLAEMASLLGKEPEMFGSGAASGGDDLAGLLGLPGGSGGGGSGLSASKKKTAGERRAEKKEAEARAADRDDDIAIDLDEMLPS